MASVTLSITDRADGGLDVAFKGTDLRTATRMKRNTCAQNAAIALTLWMGDNGLGADAPDLTSESSLAEWISKQPSVSGQRCVTDVDAAALCEEVDALRKAVRIMGFDAGKLAEFVANKGDSQCKFMLLSCITLSEEMLTARGAGDLQPWREYFSRLRRPELAVGSDLSVLRRAYSNDTNEDAKALFENANLRRVLPAKKQSDDAGEKPVL